MVNNARSAVDRKPHKLDQPVVLSTMDDVQKKTQAASILWNAQDVICQGVGWM